jgi:hypothetical protein
MLLISWTHLRGSEHFGHTRGFLLHIKGLKIQARTIIIKAASGSGTIVTQLITTPPYSAMFKHVSKLSLRQIPNVPAVKIVQISLTLVET